MQIIFNSRQKIEKSCYMHFQPWGKSKLTKLLGFPLLHFTQNEEVKWGLVIIQRKFCGYEPVVYIYMYIFVVFLLIRQNHFGVISGFKGQHPSGIPKYLVTIHSTRIQFAIEYSELKKFPRLHQNYSKYCHDLNGFSVLIDRC